TLWRELDACLMRWWSLIRSTDWGRRLLSVFVLIRQMINDAIRAVLLASSHGADLDQIGGNLNVGRLLITPEDDTTTPPTPAVYETDDDYRARIQLSWARLSTAGAKNSYQYFALSADPDILDARPYGPETHDQEGRVFLYVLSRAGVEAWVKTEPDEDTVILTRAGAPTTPQPLLDAVAASVNDDEVRPLTDFVTISAGEPLLFAIDADIHMPYGLDGDLVMTSAVDAIMAYTDSTYRFDTVAARSGVDKALHQAGVIRVDLRSPAADVIPAMGQAPYCTSITLKKVVADYD
ncbi:baseplate assembly protein J, partial [Trabulsiella guamensis ATCC 49490]